MAKFCGNCGAQMSDSAKVCGMCGTPFTSSAKENAAPGNIPASPVKAVGIPGVSAMDGNLTIMYIAEAALFLLLGILSLVKMFRVDSLLSLTFTIVQLFEDAEFIPVIVIILIFVAAILSAVPIFSAPKRRRFIFQIVVSALAFLLVVFTCIIHAASDESAFYDLSLTFAGWLYMLICIANIVLSVLISKKSQQELPAQGQMSF